MPDGRTRSANSPAWPECEKRRLRPDGRLAAVCASGVTIQSNKDQYSVPHRRLFALGASQRGWQNVQRHIPSRALTASMQHALHESPQPRLDSQVTFALAVYAPANWRLSECRNIDERACDPG